jgi:hypothetical protein
MRQEKSKNYTKKRLNNPRSQIRDQKSDARDQRLVISSQKSEVRGRNHANRISKGLGCYKVANEFAMEIFERIRTKDGEGLDFCLSTRGDQLS